MNWETEYRPWTPAEDTRLTDLLRQGLTMAACAERLGRSYKGVQERLLRKPELRPAEADVRGAWTPADDLLILTLAHQGQPLDEIAGRIKRTRKSVACRLYRLRKGKASTAGRMGRPKAAEAAPPAFAEQERRQIVAARLRQEAEERLSLFRLWDTRNTRLRERLAREQEAAQ